VQRGERASEPVAHVVHLGRLQPILELACKSVRLPLEATRHAVERDTDDGFHRRQDHLKHQKRHHRRWTCRDGPREIKGTYKLRRVQKGGKEREDTKDVDLGDAEELGGVHVVPVTEFVGEDGFDLVWFAFFDEGIKDDDMFAPWETEKLGVAVRAAFRSVDLVQVF